MNIKDLIENVRALANEYPDTVYTPIEGKSCFYLKGTGGDGCGCLIGQAAIRTDPSCRSVLAKADNTRTGGSKPILDIISSIAEKYTENEADWLSLVQDGQDINKTWSCAVFDADENVSL